ncbi:hypothetical protein B0189_02345 [Moraxella cuniculi]|nr:hypothetical protein B0189_02345 [Moraxella cuniculi]
MKSSQIKQIYPYDLSSSPWYTANQDINANHRSFGFSLPISTDTNNCFFINSKKQHMVLLVL